MIKEISHWTLVVSFTNLFKSNDGWKITKLQFSSVAQLYLTLCDPMDCSMPGLPVHHQLPEFTQTHVHWVSWWHPTISFSFTRFSSCLQSFLASRSFLMSQFFASRGQSTGASASVLTVSIQGWFPLGLIGLISFLSKGLSRVFFSPGGSFSSLDCLLAPKDLHPSHIKIYHPFPRSSKVSTYYNINVQSKISLHIYQFDSPKPLY